MNTFIFNIYIFAFERIKECERKHLHNFIHTLFLFFIKSSPANYNYNPLT